MTTKRPLAASGSRATEVEEALEVKALRRAARAEAEAAEAEAAAAEAAAAAAEARLLAIRTRQRVAQSASARGAEQTPAALPAMADTEAHDRVEDLDGDEDSFDTLGGEDVAARPRARRSRKSWLTALALLVAVALIVAGSGASGYMAWQHHTAAQQHQRKAEFNAAARQGVINLMSVNSMSAQQDVQRLIDSSTGKFKNDLQDTVDALTASLEQAKVTTTVTVQSTAVESMSADSGVVLVAASTEAVDGKSEERRPARWRLAVTLTRDSGQLKMSQVDFIS